MRFLKPVLNGIGEALSRSKSNFPTVEHSTTTQEVDTAASQESRSGPNPEPETTKRRKKTSRKGNLASILDDEPGTEPLHPAQDFTDGKLFFGITTSDGCWIINSKQESFRLSKGSHSQYSFRHHSIDTCRFSPEGIKAFLGANPPVDPGKLFEDVRQLVARYIFFPDRSQADLVALWSMGTYVFSVFRYFPYIWLNAEKASGKSLLLKILSELTFNGQVLLDITPAVLFRDVDTNRPTLLIDEFERFRKQDKENMNAVISILNSGFETGNVVKRMERSSGSSFKIMKFQTYSPKIFAGINDIDDVLQDRTIQLKLLRKTQGEVVQRFKMTAQLKDEITRLVDRMYIFGLQFANDLFAIYNGDNGGVRGTSHLENRELDIWEPLFAIANVVDAANDSSSVTESLCEFSKRSSEERQHENISKNETYQLLNVLVGMLEEVPPLETDSQYQYLEAERVFEHFQKSDEFSWLQSKNALTTRLKRIGVLSTRRKRGGKRTAVYRLDPIKFDDFCTRFRIERSDGVTNFGASGTIDHPVDTQPF